jgi:hypothetical protein
MKTGSYSASRARSSTPNARDACTLVRRRFAPLLVFDNAPTRAALLAHGGVVRASVR